MPTIKQGTSAPAASVVSDRAKQSLFARLCGQKVARKFGSLESITDICSALHNNQREQLANEAGIFYTRLYRFRTPLSVLNGPTAGYSVERRVGTKPFHLHIVKLS